MQELDGNLESLNSNKFGDNAFIIEMVKVLIIFVNTSLLFLTVYKHVKNLLSYCSNFFKKVGEKLICHLYKIIKTFKSYYHGK